jgi:hypothetical protein
MIAAILSLQAIGLIDLLFDPRATWRPASLNSDLISSLIAANAFDREK